MRRPAAGASHRAPRSPSRLPCRRRNIGCAQGCGPASGRAHPARMRRRVATGPGHAARPRSTSSAPISTSTAQAIGVPCRTSHRRQRVSSPAARAPSAIRSVSGTARPAVPSTANSRRAECPPAPLGSGDGAGRRHRERQVLRVGQHEDGADRERPPRCAAVRDEQPPRDRRLRAPRGGGSTAGRRAAAGEAHEHLERRHDTALLVETGARATSAAVAVRPAATRRPPAGEGHAVRHARGVSSTTSRTTRGSGLTAVATARGPPQPVSRPPLPRRSPARLSMPARRPTQFIPEGRRSGSTSRSTRTTNRARDRGHRMSHAGGVYRPGGGAGDRRVGDRGTAAVVTSSTDGIAVLEVTGSFPAAAAAANEALLRTLFHAAARRGLRPVRRGRRPRRRDAATAAGHRWLPRALAGNPAGPGHPRPQPGRVSRTARRGPTYSSAGR